MSLVDSFPQLWEDMEPKLSEVAKEAAELRARAEPSEVGDELGQLQEKLIAARKCQDRLETLVADIGRIRSRARVARSDAFNAFEDKQDASVMNTAKEEFTTGLEVRARHRAAAIEEQMALRKVERILAQIEEVYDYLQVLYRGLDGSRRDIETQTRIFATFNRMEH